MLRLVRLLVVQQWNPAAADAEFVDDFEQALEAAEAVEAEAEHVVGRRESRRRCARLGRPRRFA